jgi:hypothetical protein
MSKIGNHRVEVQETDDYRFGWESAERGEPKPSWYRSTAEERVRYITQRLGWQDYHDQEKAK